MRYMKAGLGLLASFWAVLSLAHAGSIDTQEVDRRISFMMKKPELVGLSIAIIEDGDLVFAKGYGSISEGSNQPVTPDTVFRWASLSKSVAAATVMSLAQDGHFGLDSPVKAHAPSLELPQSNHMVTIEDLLTHRTGITPNAYDGRIEHGMPAKIVRSSLKSAPRICEPGDCYSYQNVAFDAAAEMVETATNMPYKAVVSERFFKPLHMTSASLTMEGLVRSKNWARPHNRRGGLINHISPAYYNLPGAAGINSSITDLSKWMQAQMDTGNSALPPSLRDALQKPRVATPSENRRLRRNYHAMQNAQYGLGWRIYDYAGHRVIGHRGAVQGYRSLVLFDPDKRSGVAVMWNSDNGRPVGLQLEVMDQLYGLPKRDWLRLG